MTTKPDVLVRNEGTVFAFCPLTKEAKQWVKENIELEPWQWLGNTFCVEHRYAMGLGQGMKDAGLVLARTEEDHNGNEIPNCRVRCK